MNARRCPDCGGSGKEPSITTMTVEYSCKLCKGQGIVTCVTRQ